MAAGGVRGVSDGEDVSFLGQSKSPATALPGGSALVLTMIVAAVAVAAIVVTDWQKPLPPHATCPVMATWNNPGGCLDSLHTTDVQVQIMSGGRCRICYVRLG